MVKLLDILLENVIIRKFLINERVISVPSADRSIFYSTENFLSDIYLVSNANVASSPARIKPALNATKVLETEDLRGSYAL